MIFDADAIEAAANVMRNCVANPGTFALVGPTGIVEAMLNAAVATLSREELVERLWHPVCDPGHYVERLRHFPPNSRQVEPLGHWQARAIVAALVPEADSGG